MFSPNFRVERVTFRKGFYEKSEEVVYAEYKGWRMGLGLGVEALGG
jgi:hypothetical protein